MREVRWGVEGEWCNGVFITEGQLRGARVAGPVQVEVSRQNASLTAVREAVAAEAQRLGANVVTEFQYGQKGHHALSHFNPFKWDSESWFGSGTALRIS